MPLFKSKATGSTNSLKTPSPPPAQEPSKSKIGGSDDHQIAGPFSNSGVPLKSVASNSSVSNQGYINDVDVHRSRSMSQRFRNLFVHEDDSSAASSRPVSRVNSTSSLLKKQVSSGVAQLASGLPHPLTHQPPLPIPDRGQPAAKPHFTVNEDIPDIDDVIESNNNGMRPFSPQNQPATSNSTLNLNSAISKPRARSKTLSSPHSNLYAHNSENASFGSGLFELKHSKTVNYSTTHSHNQRDKILKLKSGRLALYDYGRAHEHDFYKFRTQVSKTSTAGLLGWMKRKEEDNDKFTSIEQSVSLLPDKYSKELIVLKNNPKNVIWNYDDDEEPEDDTNSNGNPANPILSLPKNHVNNESDDELDNVRAKHGIEDPIKALQTQKRKSFTHSLKRDDDDDNDDGDDDDDDDDDNDSDDDSDDDDDFDDVIDNMMIEPIIGTEQVYLIDTVMDKIVHPENFIKTIETRKQNGKYKETLSSKYGRINGVIGKGSYGTVCITLKKNDNREPIYFAIKQLQKKTNESLKHFGTRVASEFMISSSLTHQAIINVYDLMFDPITKIYSQVMEFMPCGDLYSLIYHTKGLDIVECDCFFKQILNAVTYLHSVGISHNDLKVENLLLTKKGQLKIIDFGTSAVFRTQWESDIQLSKGACGSERYIAPEQFIESREYDPRLGDVWALGIIYLVMYYGYYAWETAKKSDDGYRQFLEQKAKYDYTQKNPNIAHQFFCTRKPAYGPIEQIRGGILNSWIQSGEEIVPNGCECDPCINRALSPNNIIGSGGIKSVNKSDGTNSKLFTDELSSLSNSELKMRNTLLKKNTIKATPETINNSRRYVLYNILNPDAQFRMRTYQIWQSDWIKETKVCDAGRGYVSYENYLEMTMKSVMGASERDNNLNNSDTNNSSPVTTPSGNGNVETKKKKHGLFGL